MHQLLVDLLALEPSDLPFLSLYLDTRPGETGRVQGRRQRNAFKWLKRRHSEVSGGLPTRGPARDSLERDVERILRFLEESLEPATRGVALFACDGRGVFRHHQFHVPFENELYVDEVPHIYPLARLLDGHEACAAVLADSENARIYTVALGRAVRQADLHHELERPPEVPAFGATQLRYQRYLEGQVQHHLKSVAEQLERIVASERLGRVVVSGSDTIAAELVRMLPKSLQEKVVDRLHLDPSRPENEVLRATMGILERKDAEDRARKVEWLSKEDLSDGLGALGLGRTLRALNEGNVDQLLLSNAFRMTGYLCDGCDQLLDFPSDEGACRYCGGTLRRLDDLREPMVARAERQGARIDVIEGHPLLAGPGGVGAILRYRAAASLP